MMPARPSYPGMMPGMPGSMAGIMGPDKQYQMTFKPHATMSQGPNLRHQLQVRLVSLYLWHVKQYLLLENSCATLALFSKRKQT